MIVARNRILRWLEGVHPIWNARQVMLYDMGRGFVGGYPCCGQTTGRTMDGNAIRIFWKCFLSTFGWQTRTTFGPLSTNVLRTTENGSGQNERHNARGARAGVRVSHPRRRGLTTSFAAAISASISLNHFLLFSSSSCNLARHSCRMLNLCLSISFRQ